MEVSHLRGVWFQNVISVYYSTFINKFCERKWPSCRPPIQKCILTQCRSSPPSTPCVTVIFLVNEACSTWNPFLHPWPLPSFLFLLLKCCDIWWLICLPSLEWGLQEVSVPVSCLTCCSSSTSNITWDIEDHSVFFLEEPVMEPHAKQDGVTSKKSISWLI